MEMARVPALRYAAWTSTSGPHHAPLDRHLRDRLGLYHHPGPARSAPPENRGKPDHAGNDNGKGNGKGNGNSGKNKGNGKDADTNVSVTLTTAGISISTARGYAVQAGATGYGSLPPGIRKNLARGKPLPRGSPKDGARPDAGPAAGASRL